MPGRPRRADALRNRERILDAARAAITARGAEAGMDEIAAAAGVAVGTLYRHFPTKADLVAAIVAEHVEAVADDAEASAARVAAGARALDEFTGFLMRLVDAAAGSRAAKAAAVSIVTVTPDRATEDRAAAALASMIAAAQTAGDIRPDFAIEDVYLLWSTAPTDQPAAARTRWLELVVSGIATDAGRRSLP